MGAGGRTRHAYASFAECSLTRTAPFERFTALASQIFGVEGRPQDQQNLAKANDYVMLETMTVADRAAPLDQVETPQPAHSYYGV